jgi:hypothetical protein
MLERELDGRGVLIQARYEMFEIEPVGRLLLDLKARRKQML